MWHGSAPSRGIGHFAGTPWRGIARTPALPSLALVFMCMILAFVVLSAGVACADTPQVISPTGTISTPLPTIWVKFIGTSTTNVYGAVTKTVPASMSLRLDGVPIAFTTSAVGTSYPVQYEMLACGPVLSPLSEGTHTVVASSSTGMTTWTFVYAQNENSVCRSCHGEFNPIHLDLGNYYDPGLAAFEGMKHTYYDWRYDLYPPVLPDQHAACLWCHQKLDTVVNDPGPFTDHQYNDYINVNVDVTVAGRWCQICHAKPFFDILDKDGRHGSSAAFSYTALPADAVIATPRESLDCVYCHQAGAAQPEVIGPHDMTDEHSVALETDCAGSGCHSAVLTDEHSGRTSSAGSPVTCRSCHLSADAGVRAIAGKQWVGNKDRWEASAHRLGPYGPAQIECGPWSYTRDDNGDGVAEAIPVTRVNVRIKGTAEATLYAYYGNQWNQVLYQPDRPASTYLSGVTTIHDPDREYDLELPGATAFKWTIVTRYNWDMQDGARMGITVVETNPARPEVSCDSCHDEPYHPSHETAIDARCAKCHGTDLTDTHTQEGCKGCHASAAAKARVAFRQRACGDCHSVAHAQSLATSPTADIYFDPDFRFNAPISASIFSGESWMPSEVVTMRGSVALGQRAPVTLATAWQRFSAEMADRGWTVPEGPAVDATSFSVTLTRGTQRCRLVLYATDSHSGSGSTSPGTRAEVIWWSTE